MNARMTMLLALALAGTLVRPAAAADSAVWSRPMLTPEAAMQAARAAQAECRKQGWQVTVSVTDASAVPLVVLRDRFAGWHTVEGSIDKARTAASWRGDTASLAARVMRPGAPEKAVEHIPGVLMLGGGIPMEAAGQVVGAIGVSGAPGVDNDVLCAKAGIAAIEAELAF